MTRFFSENNLPALLTRLKALDEQSYNKISAMIPTKLSELENDEGYQTNAIESIIVGGEEVTSEDKSINLDNGLDAISLEDINAIFDAL